MTNLDPLDRHHPVESLSFRVKQFNSQSEMAQYVRERYDPNWVATRTEAAREELGSVLVPDDTGPANAPTTANTGVPTGTSLTTITAEQAENLPAGDLNDYHIVGEYTPTIGRVHNRCLLEGTTTPSVVGVVNGVMQVTAANAPRYAVNTHQNNVPSTWNDCSFRHAGKLLYCSADTDINRCYFHNAGEDAVFMGYQTGVVQLNHVLITRMGDLAYHHTLGQTKVASHPDGVQCRGQAIGAVLTIDDTLIDGINDTSGTLAACNRAILAQSGSAPVRNVRVLNSWLSCQGNYIIGLRDKNHGPVEVWVLQNNRFDLGYLSAGTQIDGGSGTATGNIMRVSGANVDDLILNGGAWE